MKRGEAKFRESLHRLRKSRWSWPPRLTPAQWFRLVVLVLGLLAALLGIEGEALQSLVELLVK